MTYKGKETFSRCRGIKKIPWSIADNALLVVLLLIFISFALGGLIFYKYFILDQGKAIVSQDGTRFNQGSYQRISEKWVAKEQLIIETSQNIYPDPFKLKSITSKKN